MTKGTRSLYPKGIEVSAIELLLKKGKQIFEHGTKGFSGCGKGDCCDNAVVESLFRIQKPEV